MKLSIGKRVLVTLPAQCDGYTTYVPEPERMTITNIRYDISGRVIAVHVRDNSGHYHVVGEHACMSKYPAVYNFI